MTGQASVVDACVCCGRDWPNRPNCRTDSGPMHFSCWEEHHSDPTSVWLPEHACAGAEAKGDDRG